MRKRIEKLEAKQPKPKLKNIICRAIWGDDETKPDDEFIAEWGHDDPPPQQLLDNENNGTE